MLAKFASIKPENFAYIFENDPYNKNKLIASTPRVLTLYEIIT